MKIKSGSSQKFKRKAIVCETKKREYIKADMIWGNKLAKCKEKTP